MLLNNALFLGVVAVFTMYSALPVSACGRRFSDKAMEKMKLVYPDARRNESVVDDYHGTQIADPYRWLENPDSAETQSFVAAQNALTNMYVEQYPHKQKIRDSLNDMYNYSRYDCPEKHGGYYYYLFNSGLQNQRVMYAKRSLDAEPHVFFDPNTLSDDGTIAMMSHSFSPDGQYMAYTLTQGGSDWVTIKFKRAPSGDDLPDVLERVKFTGLAWTADNAGIFYTYFPEKDSAAGGTDPALDLDQKVRYHPLGTDQTEDEIAFELPEDPTWLTLYEMSDCGNYLILTPRQGAMPDGPIYYVDLRADADSEGKLPYVKLIDNFDAQYQYVTNEGAIFTFKTNFNAPNFKVINIDLDRPDVENWEDLVAEQSDGILEWAASAGNTTLILCYMRDVKNELYVGNLNTGSPLIQLPLDVGAIKTFTAQKSENEVFYKFASFLTPGIIYRYDVSHPEQMPQVYQQSQVKGLDFNQYVTKQHFYKSKDGTLIPMFLIHRKGIVLDGSHPGMLNGYGGFSSTLAPSFTVAFLVFVQNLHGVAAVANVRGEGNSRMTEEKLQEKREMHDLMDRCREYGETWHQAGMRANKQNVFDDFRAAAEYLISEGYTSSSKLTIFGGSNGGLLMGASANQRPDLYGCVIAQVPMMDMLRFTKRGAPQNMEFGSSDEPDQFAYLVKYSPLHNIAVPTDGGQYPAILAMTGDHDTTVPPLHSYKYIAQLQHVMGKHTNQTNPLMLRVATNTGHLGGTSITKVLEESTDSMCFVVQSLNLQWHDTVTGVLTSKTGANFCGYSSITMTAVLLIITMLG